QMSGGRVELGFGAGWYRAEHATFGIPFPDVAERFDRFAEQLEIVHGLLAAAPGSSYSFTGRYYELAGSALPELAPARRPPIIVGGAAKKRGARLAARFADEFNSPFRTLPETAASYEAVRSASVESGRELTYSVAHTVCVGRTDAELARRAEAIG